MFRTFFGFELNYWLKGVMVYIFFFIISMLIMGAASSENVTLQQSFSVINLNSPYVIQFYYGIVAILTCLLTTAFVNDAASRDFAHQTNQLIFTKPINKYSFLMGRFWGSVLIALIPMLGVTCGILMAPHMPWAEPTRYSATNWSAHFWGVLMFAIPNTIFISAIIFAIAVWLRSTFASFIGVIVLLTAWGISQSVIGSLDDEFIRQMLDPFGLAAFEVQTKYWTIADRNTSVLTFSNMTMLLNRAVWLSVGLGILLAACWRFSFAERKTKSKKLHLDSANLAPAAAITIPHVSFQHGMGAQLKQWWSQYKIDFVSTVKSPVFLVIVFAGIIDTFTSLRFVATEGFGLKSLPVTYSMIEIIRGSLFSYLMVVVIFYTGVLVWKEREAKLDEVYDALPHSIWISYSAKLVTILSIILIVILAETLMSIGVQASEGYNRFQLGLYAKELFGITFVELFCYTVIAFFSHIISPNKYIGFFLFIMFAIVNNFAWGLLDIESNMLQFAGLPSYTYSDLFKFAPFATGIAWFSAYWVLFCVFLSSVGVLLWQRGRERGFFKRLGIAGDRLRGKMGVAAIVTFGIWAAVGSWVYYNTQVRNEYQTTTVNEGYQVNYEKTFKYFEKLPNPRVIDVKYTIDVFPKKRGLVFKGEQTIANQSDQPISQVLVNVADGFETELEIEGATLLEDYPDYQCRIFELDPALAPGKTAQMSYTVSYEPKGFENSVSQLQLVQNGTFFNNGIAPQLGYQSSFEITDESDRKYSELPERETMPLLDPKNMAARSNTYTSNNSDWVNVETIISTSNDQIAVAPGSLIKKWEKDGRRYFHYKVDHPSLNMYSFISADYKVALRKWKGVDIEVYYHHEHEWNVSNMLRSISKSLDYFSEAFGPYKHKQARIIEFPRTSSFAQAFPGTMPYSEGIGFIAAINKSDDIDMVYYVVAHEMAHQWWAHQVIGANMQGATLLSETLAQYSALMVMEKEFGRDIMRKFLKYEMDAYLRGRSAEQREELPLMKVTSQQQYIHYRKGSLVMYYLKEMIGEDKVNAALRSLVDDFAYAGPPYPTSIDLVEKLREQTPEEYQYLLKDLFEEITLFENRVLETSFKELPDGKFEVSLEIECQKFRAGEAGEQTKIEINDWIEIGAFAKPEEESMYGKTLYRERVKVDQEKTSYTFVVDEVPVQVGVDPFSLLIDRLPDDNLKKPKKTDSQSP